MSEKLILSDKTFKIIGAAMEVHNTIGCGFTEPLYQEAFEEELRLRGIPYQREKTFHVVYKGKKLNKEFRPDFVCYDEIIIELKAVQDLVDEHYSQVYNYLKATGLRLGMLINFGKKSLEYKRIPCDKKW
ncbi:MAG: GxxExxY protein [Muribaculaceae bacterium]|jgi:GxxExxY protein|nr:GxxExxY protein [Muribaculaceae bacterium]